MRPSNSIRMTTRRFPAATAAMRPGISFRDVHFVACRRIASGLKDLGIMKGDVDEAVAAGAHALFFPHGLGHMLGLDVHDMEGLGENHVGYNEEVKRAEHIRVRYLDRSGEPVEMDAEGLLAVCIQHEMDHLDGVLFIDRVSPLKRRMLLKKWSKMDESGRQASS